MDHLAFTGSAAVGREVMRAAAANLVPVTLELGGKCPVVVGADKVTDRHTITSVARIKVIKHGQMCISDDYCLVPRAALDSFAGLVVDFWREHFAADGGAASSCGIITDRHVGRLSALVADARERGAAVIQVGPDPEPGSRRMPLYVVVDPPVDCALMREEIFGPILPILPYDSLDDVVAQVGRGGHPLALYVFTDDPSFVTELTRRTRSGGVAINSVAGHAVLPSLGFGGVGASGMGRHHGQDGFRELSNRRGYFALGSGSVTNAVTPPYGPQTRALLDVADGTTLQQLRFGLPRHAAQPAARTAAPAPALSPAHASRAVGGVHLVMDGSPDGRRAGCHFLGARVSTAALLVVVGVPILTGCPGDGGERAPSSPTASPQPSSPAPSWSGTIVPLPIYPSETGGLETTRPHAPGEPSPTPTPRITPAEPGTDD